MTKHLWSTLLGISLFLFVPSVTAAHPGDDHHDDGHHGDHDRFEHRHPQADWSAYPPEFQVYKGQLDQLREQQKGLFEQFKQQRGLIRSQHDKLSPEKRKALKANVKDLLVELQSARNTIHTLRDQKIAAWEQFYQHSLTKDWTAAKVDIQTVVARKQDIIAKQRSILETQQRIVERMKK